MRPGIRALCPTLVIGLTFDASIHLAAPRVGLACPWPFDLEEAISFEVAPGRNEEVMIGGMSQETGAPRCSAWISVPLSAFPTARLATRPADLASSLRDAVEKIGAEECDVSVYYENDTNEDVADHELCLSETFRFGERKVWSTSRESFCWEPDPVLELELEPDFDTAPDEEDLVSVE